MKKYPEKKAAANLKLRYGITAADYGEILASQDGLCAICGKPPVEGSRKLVVDHDHSTGRVRGLIHYRCNSAIGFLDDDPNLLRAAANYLDRYQG